MIDWHSHILPGMDDGSRDVEESISMLDAFREQHVEYVIATPHFYANDESVDTFLERRAMAYAALSERRESSHPQVLCGAEVRYYPGIGKMLGIDRLAIETTRLLLLEMPISKWTEYTIRELVELSSSKNLTIIMAHVERYWNLQHPSVWAGLRASGLLMQSNAGFIYGTSTGRKAMKLLREGKIQLIGSDCHNMTTRPPQIEKAYCRIEKKFGESYVSQMNQYSKGILEHNFKNLI